MFRSFLTLSSIAERRTEKIIRAWKSLKFLISAAEQLVLNIHTRSKKKQPWCELKIETISVRSSKCDVIFLPCWSLLLVLWFIGKEQPSLRRNKLKEDWRQIEGVFMRKQLSCCERENLLVPKEQHRDWKTSKQEVFG